MYRIVHVIHVTCVILLILLLPVWILGSVWIYLFDAYLLRHNQRILDDYKNYIEEVKRIVHTLYIEGAGSGIGRAVCRVFASEGATIIGADMNEKGMEETLAMIKDTGKIYGYWNQSLYQCFVKG